MTRFRLLSIALIGAGFGLATLPSVLVGSSIALAAGDAVRPEVGKPLQAAQELIKRQNYKGALAEIHKADEVKDKTTHEILLIEQMRGSAAEGAGDTATAIHSFEAVINSGSLSATEQLNMIQAIASLSYRAKDYPKTIAWLNRYFKDGGTDPKMHALLGQTYYANNDFVNAAKIVQDDIKTEEKAGKNPTEEQLQLLQICYLKQNDMVAYTAVVEKLVTFYPKPDYWSDLIRRTATKPGFSDRLSTDIGRLRLATGTLKTNSEYMEQIQLALQDGVPGEAKTVMEKGTAAKILGVATGPAADRETRLHNLVTKTIDEDQKARAHAESEAKAAKDGTALVNLGFDDVGYGKFDTGIPLMEQGLQKDALKHPEDAKLHLGIAYLLAGQKPKAVQILKTVQGTDGTAALARLWLIQSGTRPS
jgi:tetratricopeptide (TPR) repeat protein